MERKLVKQGIGAITVSIPKKWANKNHLGPGDQVSIKERPSELIISPKSGESQRKLEVNITNLQTKTVREIVQSAYLKGVTDLTLNFKNKTIKGNIAKLTNKKGATSYSIKKIHRRVSEPIVEFIEDVLQDMMGFEIVEQGSSFVKIKQISKVDEEEFGITLRRIYRLVYSLNSELGKHLEKPVQQELILNKVHNIKKFVNYGLRLIKVGVIKKHELNYYSILQRFENIVHIYRFLAVFVEQSGRKADKQTIKMVEDVGELMDFAQKAFYEFSYDKYDSFQDQVGAVYGRNHLKYKEVSKKDVRVMQALTSCVRDLRVIMGNTVSIQLE